MYLDESGVASLTDKNYINFLLTGIILDDQEDPELSAYFNFIRRKHKILEHQSFHAYSLFEDNQSKLYLSDRNAKKLADSLAEFIDISPINVRVCFLNKDSLKKHMNIHNDTDFTGSEQKKRDKDTPYEILSKHLFFWFADFTKKEKARGAIVAESRKHSDYTVLRTYLACKEPLWNSSSIKLTQSSNNMNNHIGSIRFESKISIRAGLEMTDLISYVTFLSIEGKLQKFRKRGLVPLWHKIKNKLEKKTAQKIDKRSFRKYLSPDRVHKTPKNII